ncbi:MAG: hypothetical protein M3Y07_03495 [Acidobacteriota bacterium]|nr:hypothetical protein [Acidobacteriota bacterium]
MRFIFKTLLAGTLSIAALSAETKAAAETYSVGASAQPKAARQKSKPLKWLLRACSAEVEFPLWLSSRGISKAEISPSNEPKSFRFAVEPESGPDAAPAGIEE